MDAMKEKGGRLLVRTREGIERTTEEAGLFFTVADSGAGMTREESASCLICAFPAQPLMARA